MNDEILRKLEVRRREWEAEGGRTTYWSPRQDIHPAVRDAINKRAGYRCEICERCDNLQLHHLHYRSVGYELPADLKLLCDSCHRAAHIHFSPWFQKRPAAGVDKHKPVRRKKVG